MRILITGRTGLAQALNQVYADEQVMCVSRGTGHDINEVHHWGREFLEYDLVINCAYSERGQCRVLEYFFSHWKDLAHRCIATIGSRVTYMPRSELHMDSEYWPYRQHKRDLQSMHDSMLITAQCDLKIINPGPFHSEMSRAIAGPKLDINDLAQRIRAIISDPTLKRVDLWL